MKHVTNIEIQVSGLKEDLHLEGNQYSVLLAMASVG